MEKSIVRPMTPDEAEEALRGIGHKIVYDLDRFPPLHERVKALNLAANTMEWTTEAPTKPGWYWIYVPWTKDLICINVEISSEQNRIEFIDYVDGYECASRFAPHHVSHWLGPIPVPEVPKDNIEQ